MVERSGETSRQPPLPWQLGSQIDPTGTIITSWYDGEGIIFYTSGLDPIYDYTKVAELQVQIRAEREAFNRLSVVEQASRRQGEIPDGKFPNLFRSRRLGEIYFAVSRTAFSSST